MSPDSRSSLAAPHAHDSRALLKVIVATSVANCLELFDFTVFGLFAATIGEQFFPAANSMTSLLLAVGTFGVGFLMRPFGAFALGRYADRVGRRAAMTLTIWLMGVATACIAVCPPYAAIGISAPLIVLMARIVQGFAAGGEIGAAASYALEASPPARRGYVVSWQLAGQAAAALIGACIGVVLSHALAPAAFAAWGWRVPFAFGLLIVPVGIYVRRRLPEIAPPAFAATARRGGLLEPYRSHGGSIVLATLMMLWRTVPFYTIVIYLPSYVTRVMHMRAEVGFRSSALSALVLVVASPLGGVVADRVRRRKPLLLWSAGLTAVLVYPVFASIAHAQSELPILLGVALISLMLALGTCASTVLVLEHWPAQVRASGYAVSYAIGVALFGGTAQFIVTALVGWTGNPMSITWYVVPACLVSWVACALFRERRAAA